MNNPFSLNNKIALVTGGGSGIGFDISKCLLDAGAKVIITGRRQNMLETAVKTLGSNAHYIVNDVSDLSQTEALVTEITNTFGPIDILVNNAGINMKSQQ